ncbi:MAG: hypothetical protein ACSLE5_05030 [Porticoccaceae bacterium]
MMNSPKLCTLVLLLVATSGLAAEPSAQQGVVTAAPALAARYELRIGNHTTDWYLTRTAARIETFNVGSRQGEIWERAANGAIDYRRVFFSDRKIVEYSAGELRARGAAPQWTKLASLVDPRVIAGLRQTGEQTLSDRRALMLEGDIDSEPARLWWLPDAQLPARLERGVDARRVQLDLRELHQAPPAGWPRMDDDGLAGFSVIDAADFGDMESDPFVQKVMAQDGRAHGPSQGHGHD